MSALLAAEDNIVVVNRLPSLQSLPCAFMVGMVGIASCVKSAHMARFHTWHSNTSCLVPDDQTQCAAIRFPKSGSLQVPAVRRADALVSKAKASDVNALQGLSSSSSGTGKGPR